MPHPVLLSDYRPRAGKVFFDRAELMRILSVYSRQVARGLWRDYALDHRSNMAMFSIYRRAQGQALFVITKVELRGDREAKYVLQSRNGQLVSSRSLKDVMDVLNKQLMIVN